jgi:aconitate hydratase
MVADYAYYDTDYLSGEDGDIELDLPHESYTIYVDGNGVINAGWKDYLEPTGQTDSVTLLSFDEMIQKAEKAREAGECMGEALPELRDIMHKIKETYDVSKENVGVGSTIFAVKPGDGSAREQAASCQKVLGGWANIANEYATKRYRSNLINWGMLPFIIDKGELPFTNGDYIFIPKIADAVKNKATSMKAYVVNKDMKEFELKMDELTDDEREIILDGCLINYYRNH